MLTKSINLIFQKTIELLYSENYNDLQQLYKNSYLTKDFEESYNEDNETKIFNMVLRNVEKLATETSEHKKLRLCSTIMYIIGNKIDELVFEQKLLKLDNFEEIDAYNFSNRLLQLQQKLNPNLLAEAESKLGKDIGAALNVIKHFVNGAVETAKDEYIKFILIEPNDLWRWCMLHCFDLRDHLNNNEIIIYIYQLLTNISYTNKNVLYVISRAFSILGIQRHLNDYLLKSEELIELALTINSHCRNALFQKIWIMKNLNRNYISLLEHSLVMYPEYSKGWEWLAKYNIEKDNIEKAIDCYLNAKNYGGSYRILKILINLSLKINKTSNIYNYVNELIKSEDAELILNTLFEYKDQIIITSFHEVLQIYSCPSLRKKYKKALNSFMCRIFECTEKHESKGIVRYKLLRLLKLVFDLNKPIKRHSEKSNYCHYSRLESLQYLVKPSSEMRPKFRFFNTSYMNDPSEGQIFLEYIKRNSEIVNLIEYLFPIDDTNNENGYFFSNVFIGSFTKSKDSLPMWTQYGDNGQGCCYVFNENFFDNKENRSDYAENVFEDCSDKQFVRKVEYCEPSLSNTMLSDISECLKSLENFILQDIEIRNIVIDILNRVRFLYKDKAYMHEEEYRVIVFGNEDMIRIENNSKERAVPRIYIESEKELLYNEIVLGPKVNNVMDVVPYLLHTKMVKKVTKSNIKYR